MKARDQEHLFALLHTANSLEHRMEEQLAKAELSLAKLSALHHLRLAGDSLPLGQLAERLACVRSNVTQLIDRLEADGLVTRAADAGDRRSRIAVLTEAGRRAYDRGTKIREEVERELFGVLTAEESAQLSKLMSKLVAEIR